MKPQFWLEAWREGRRGFHLPDANADLVAHGHVFPTKGRILVPLCGATHDLRWLADQGHEVVGVEFSPIAVRELAEREGLVQEGTLGPFIVHRGEGITLLEGDFFDLESSYVGQLTGVWDRAALVAMHPTQRSAYVKIQRSLLGDGVLLLSTLSYDQSKMDGPPWSVPETLVMELWPELTKILDAATPVRPKWKDAGLQALTTLLFASEAG